LPFSLESSVGRFVEARMSSPSTPEDMAHFRTRMYATLTQITGRAVIMADMTGATSFPPDVASRLIEMLKTDNPKVERTAFVLPRGANAFAQQADQMLTEAATAARAAGRLAERRTFFSRSEARAWLAEVLTPREIVRLDEFVKTIPGA
jgi:hypothetical protein